MPLKSSVLTPKYRTDWHLLLLALDLTKVHGMLSLLRDAIMLNP